MLFPSNLEWKLTVKDTFMLWIYVFFLGIVLFHSVYLFAYNKFLCKRCFKQYNKICSWWNIYSMETNTIAFVRLEMIEHITTLNLYYKGPSISQPSKMINARLFSTVLVWPLFENLDIYKIICFVNILVQTLRYICCKS